MVLSVMHMHRPCVSLLYFMPTAPPPTPSGKTIYTMPPTGDNSTNQQGARLFDHQDSDNDGDDDDLVRWTGESDDHLSNPALSATAAAAAAAYARNNPTSNLRPRHGRSKKAPPPLLRDSLLAAPAVKPRSAAAAAAAAGPTWQESEPVYRSDAPTEKRGGSNGSGGQQNKRLSSSSPPRRKRTATAPKAEGRNSTSSLRDGGAGVKGVKGVKGVRPGGVVTTTAGRSSGSGVSSRREKSPLRFSTASGASSAVADGKLRSGELEKVREHAADLGAAIETSQVRNTFCIRPAPYCVCCTD